MARFTIAASALLIAAVVAHDDVPAPGLKYAGCAEIDTATFPVAVDFFKAFTASQCVTACGAASHAAVGLSCICSEEELAEPKFTLVDDELCNRVCIADEEESGICGGEGVWSLYTSDDGEVEEPCTTSHEATETATAEPTGTEEPCSTDTVSTMVTVTGCPPEVEDCPYRPTPTEPAPCKGNGTCHEPTPTPPAPCNDCEAPEPTGPVQVGAAAGMTVGFSAAALGLLAFAML